MLLKHALLCAAILVCSPSFLFGQQTRSENGDIATVDVLVSSGKQFTAAVDRRTDDAALWLRFDRETAVLYRSMPWTEIDTVRYQGSSYSQDEFKPLAMQIRSDRPAFVTRNKNRRTEDPENIARPIAEEIKNDANHQPANTRLTFAERAEFGLSPLPRVKSIALDAFVANWDNDPEVDGIVAIVSALDAFGGTVPVRGSLNVELISERRSHLKPQPRRRRETFERIGSWARQYSPASGGEQIFVLPFQAVDPNFDFAVDSVGLVNAKLAAPGHGVYEASVTDVRIRPISSVRDRLQNSRGDRFYPTEMTGRTH